MSVRALTSEEVKAAIVGALRTMRREKTIMELQFMIALENANGTRFSAKFGPNTQQCSAPGTGSRGPNDQERKKVCRTL